MYTIYNCLRACTLIVIYWSDYIYLLIRQVPATWSTTDQFAKISHYFSFILLITSNNSLFFILFFASSSSAFGGWKNALVTMIISLIVLLSCSQLMNYSHSGRVYADSPCFMHRLIVRCFQSAILSHIYWSARSRSCRWCCCSPISYLLFHT